MIRIREFIRSGGAMSDDDLTRMLKDRLSSMTAAERPEWLHQVELAMDGYGGDVQRAAVSRVRSALDDIGPDGGANR